MSELTYLLRTATSSRVLGGTLLLGVSSGVWASFACSAGGSLMGDVLADAALPGVALAFMLTQSRTVAPLLVGAVIAGLAGTWCVDAIVRHSRIKEDTAQALVLAVFFGFGIMLLTHIAHSGAAGQSGLDRFLFGQAASLIGSDVKVIGAAAFGLTLAAMLLFKELKLLSFDPAFGEGLGFPMRALDRVLHAHGGDQRSHRAAGGGRRAHVGAAHYTGGRGPLLDRTAGSHGHLGRIHRRAVGRGGHHDQPGLPNWPPGPWWSWWPRGCSSCR